MQIVNKKNVLAALLIVVFGLSRWPGLMPPNFSAAYAMVFCAGLYLPGRLGWILPLGVLAGSDLLINLVFYAKDGFSTGAFIKAELPVWLAYAGMVALGRAFGAKRSWWTLVGGGVIGAMLFYVVTNTGAWMSLPGYQKTLSGWVQAVTIGLPGFPQTWEFFRNTLLSGGLFTGLFVGSIKLMETPESADVEEDEESTQEPEAQPVKGEPQS